MIKVVIPVNFLPEREYIIETLMSEFLNLEFTIEKNESAENYIIELPNGKSLQIRDSFFSNYNEADGYLNQSTLPEVVSYLKNDFIAEPDIPLIYGNDLLEIEKDKIVCGIDIFASSFFMLTRWEEYVLSERDVHERFPGESSLAYKFNFLRRPVVNEYIEMLWRMMLHLGIDNGLRKTGKYEIIPTHDVDHVYFNYQFKKLIGDVFIDRKPQNALKRIYFDLKKINTYDTFDWLMDVSEKKGLAARFYFLPYSTSRKDRGVSTRDQFILNLADKIKNRGHIIGFHPGYTTFNNVKEWALQKNELEKAFGISVDEGRHHYLRMEVPHTLQIWDDNNFKIDSTLYYSTQAGFRCGTADEFSFFNVLTRKKMSLKERPLIFMDETFRIRKKPAESLENARNAMRYFKEVCRKYGMPLTILFHNNNLEPLRWKGWKEFYENEVMA